MNNYYIYSGKLLEEIVYIGKGTDFRFKHLNSGKSHVYPANENHFKGDFDVEIEIMYDNLTNSEAETLERDLIKKYKPSWNTAHIRDSINREPNIKNLKKKATSKYLGVSYRPKGVSKGGSKKHWLAFYHMDKQKHEIGYFHLEIAAAVARDREILKNKLNKVLNFPDQDLDLVILESLSDND